MTKTRKQETSRAPSKREPKKQQETKAPTDLDFEKALMFFHAYMYGPLQGKLRLYEARGVKSVVKALSSDWVVFASILCRDVGTKLTKGVDLSGHEVKSAEKGGDYEYQYHKDSGKKKLKTDMTVGHLFFDHSDNLRKVALRYLPGQTLAAHFKRWLKEYPNPYKQRYRRTIPFKEVEKQGTLLMQIENGEVIYPILTHVTPEIAGAKQDFSHNPPK